jgi:PAS domain S-box-containing protein
MFDDHYLAMTAEPTPETHGKSEERYRELFENANDLMYTLDLEGNLTSLNKAGERMTGYSFEELANKSITILIEPKQIDVMRQMLDRKLGGETLTTYEVDLKAKDGSTLTLEVSSRLIYQDGQPIGVQGVARDVTERKRVEQALRVSEARYRTLAEAVRHLMWMSDPKGRVIFVNERWQEFTGDETDRHLALKWTDVLHPDDLARVLATRKSGIKAGEAYEVECRMKRADGVYRWHIARVVPLKDDNGDVLQWFGTATDIHDIKHAEESQRFLAGASSILNRSLDYETRLSELARLAVPYLADWCAVDMLDDDGLPRLLSVAHADDEKAATAHELRTRFPLDPSAAYGVPNVLRTGKSEVYSEIDESGIATYAPDPEQLRLIRHLGAKSGMIIPLVARDRTLGAITFMMSDSGRRYGASELALAEELARRAALAIDNARLYGEAQAANRLRDEFLATVSHELRTPLNAILGWAQLLRDGKLDADGSSHAFEIIERNAKTQASLIEDILDVSRIITGKLRLDAEAVELVPLTEAAIDVVRPAAQAREIQLAVSLDPRVGSIRGDVNRLQQVVWNLLSNAIKFTPEGGRVMIRLERVHNNARIVVSDSGIGIDPEFLPHVFDRFRQADSAYTRKHGGLGLGLAIVRHLVEMHGGTVRAESEGEGRGATFIVTLPLGQPRISESGLLIAGPWNETRIDTARLSAEQRQIAGGSGGAQAESAVLTGARVLVLDDESDARELIGAALANSGARVISVATTSEALGTLLECGPDTWPDVIVSDIGMPHIDGLEFIRKVRAMESGRRRRTHAIALTAYAGDDDRASALQAGFDVHISKPFDPADLARAVATGTGQESGEPREPRDPREPRET